jgi:hypothetical protein
MPAPAMISAPETVGLLLWWGVVLAAPVVILRRRGRRGRGEASHPSRRPMFRRPPVEPAALTEASTSGGNRSHAGIAGPATTPARRCAAGAPMLARLSPGTLEPLCRYVDFRRRLELATGELELRLGQLPADRWRIEPYPLTGERRNTLLVMGETGVFVVSATYAPGHWDDVVAVNRLAGKIQQLLPGYRGQVRCAVCHPFAVTSPRMWYRPDEHGDWVGAWLTGGNSVIDWLEHFGPEHGLNVNDLARFDALTTPNWLKGAIPTPPSWPPVHEAGWSDSRD